MLDQNTGQQIESGLTYVKQSIVARVNCYMITFSSTFIVAFNLSEMALQYVCTELEQSSFTAQNR